MLKSKKFRIGVEGDTTDGREIERPWIEQMAKNYEPAKYTARINCEHIRGYSPEGPFGAYGDVLELSTDTVQIDGEDKLALLASISPTPELIALNKKRQKVFTSMEVDFDFSGKGEAYLVGLAVTDSPASLGTEQLQFAAKSKKNPLASRKQKPENLFSVGTEVSLEFNDDTSLADRIKGMFKKAGDDQSNENQQFTQAIETIAGEVAQLSETVAILKPAEGKDYSAQINDLTEKLNATTTELNELKGKLEKTPNFTQRPPAAGGNEGQVVTNC